MQNDTSLYRSRHAELGSTFSRLLVNSFDAEPGEAVCSHQLLWWHQTSITWQYQPCIPVKTQVHLGVLWKISFVCFGHAFKNCWSKSYRSDIIIFPSFSKPQLLQASNWGQPLYLLQSVGEGPAHLSGDEMERNRSWPGSDESQILTHVPPLSLSFWLIASSSLSFHFLNWIEFRWLYLKVFSRDHGVLLCPLCNLKKKNQSEALCSKLLLGSGVASEQFSTQHSVPIHPVRALWFSLEKPMLLSFFIHLKGADHSPSSGSEWLIPQT